MIDIRIRISRRLVLWTVGIVAALVVLSLALQTLGESSGKVKIGPVQTEPGPNP